MNIYRAVLENLRRLFNSPAFYSVKFTGQDVATILAVFMVAIDSHLEDENDVPSD